MMKKQRRQFSTVYKCEAVKLVTEQGYSVAEACRSLDIGETALCRWMAQMKSEENGSVLPGTQPLTEE